MAKGRVIGSGPNGLAGAITLERAGVATTVFERNSRLGGGLSTGEVTLPGFRHDLGSSVYPMGKVSPFFRSLPFEIPWIEPDAPCAHPLDDGTAVMLEHSIAETAEQLDRADRASYRRLLEPIARSFEELMEDLLAPMLHVPKHPLLMARFGVSGALPATALAGMKFRGARGKALFAGMAAHSVQALNTPMSAAVGLVLMGAGHAGGWPILRGGAQTLTDLMVGYLRELGGRVEAGVEVIDLSAENERRGLSAESYEPIAESERRDLRVESSELRGESGRRELSAESYEPIAESQRHDLRVESSQLRVESERRGLSAESVGWDLTLADVTPRQLVKMAGGILPKGYRRQLEGFRYGAGAFKVDYALSEPIPWTAKECRRAATVHVGGSLEEFVESEREFRSDKPFVLLVQPSLFDTRAPAGRHTAWAYCHVTNGSERDWLPLIEAQIERFAPGFGDCVLARAVMGPAALERWNPNLVGGDLAGGDMSVRQLLFRPTRSGWRTPVKGLYLCGASTPPGGGVHGMAGYWAAMAARADLGL